MSLLTNEQLSVLLMRFCFVSIHHVTIAFHTLVAASSTLLPPCFAFLPSKQHTPKPHSNNTRTKLGENPLKNAQNRQFVSISVNYVNLCHPVVNQKFTF